MSSVCWCRGGFVSILIFQRFLFSTDQSHTVEWCYRDSWATFIVIDNNRFQLEQQFTSSSSWVCRTRKYAFPPTFARVNNSLENEIESIFIIFWFWFALQISSLFASVQLKINSEDLQQDFLLPPSFSSFRHNISDINVFQATTLMLFNHWGWRNRWWGVEMRKRDWCCCGVRNISFLLFNLVGNFSR